MADSDDEYDRKRRDKFRGERSASDNYRSDRRDDRSRGGRDDWPERGRGRPDYRDYRGSVRDRGGYSPNREAPPIKRMRPDWGDDGRPRYGGHESYGGYPGWSHEHYPMHGVGVGGGGHGFHPSSGGLHGREPPVNPDIQTQPQMMTLKQFLATQDDSISDSDAIQKYNEYKLEFKRQQLNEFFVAHKDEEWFKIKYHPEESLKRREEQLNYLKKRVEVFAELLDQGSVTSVSVDTTLTEQLLKLLDTVVIKLEGGSEEDLLVLDEKFQESKLLEQKNGEKSVVMKGDKIIDPDIEITEIQIIEDDTEKSNHEIENIIDEKNLVKNEEETTKDRKNRKHSKSGSSSSSSSSSDSEDEKEPIKPVSPKVDDVKEDEPMPTEDELIEDEGMKKDQIDDVENEGDDDKNLKKNITEKKEEDIDKSIEKIHDIDEGEVEKDVEEIIDEKKEINPDEEDKTETIDLDKEKDIDSPRALHKTSSIFLRNLAPTITKAEVEAMCKKYNGFLRVAIADPLGERRWFRRGWVTFRRDVNIKEICWNLNNIRLRDCELGAIVNRDLSRRVRPVNGITSHKTIIRSDIKLCAKIAHNLDEKSGLWKEMEKLVNNDKERSKETFGLNSKNPVLQNITDYLIEEASAEEDELLGISIESKELIDGETIEKDPQLVLVLDKLILYLRIVHSVDFYNHCEYPYEDEMPNRCGIIHARGPSPQKVTCNEIQDYIRNFETKMASFLAKNATLETGELKNMGSKDCEAEVEKFVQANTQELSKDKWLCPLSGKKFKGPDFIRKHIFNKHAEKVDEVRKEVEYFNNYLKDPKRPQLPEHPGNNKKPNEMPPAGYRPGYPPPAYAPPYVPYVPPIVAPPRPRPYGPRRGPGADYRPIIHYRDLDAPREPDEFI